MAKRSALQKIDEHEKLCRIMQKQTFEQIREMKERIRRIEYMIASPFIRKIISENRSINLLEDNPVFPNFEIPEQQITGQESRITTPNLTSPASINTQVVQSQNVSSTLPANFASLPTAQRAKIIEDFLRS